MNLPVESFFLMPDRVSSPDKLASQISSLLKIDFMHLKKLCSSNKKFEWIKRKVDKEPAEKVKALNFKEIGFLKETKRVYPLWPLASDLLGFISLDNQGLSGIEFQYDQILSGKNGKAYLIKDALGASYVIKQDLIHKPQAGESLILTIDIKMQEVLEEVLQQAIDSTHSKGASGILMNPQTGEIWAMAYKYPKANNENFSLRIKNRVICDNFEPGSTFKLITAAAALEEKLFNPEDLIYVEEGKFKIGKWTIHDISRPQDEYLTFREAIVHSSNVAVSKIGLRLGQEKLCNYIKLFGLGTPTGVDLPGESKGQLSHKVKWPEITTANIAMGQGISLNALQLVSVYAAVANRGILMQPYVVKAIVNDKNQIVKEFQPLPTRRVISEKTAATLVELLKGVVNSGTGRLAHLEGVSVAGKTGTAEKAKSGGGGYLKDEFISSFAGFFPAENPQIVGLITLDSPKGVYLGGKTAAPVFKKLASILISLPNTPLSQQLKLLFTAGTKSIPDNDSKKTPENKSKDSKPLKSVAFINFVHRISLRKG